MQSVVFLGSKEVGYFALNYLIQNSSTLNIDVIAVFSNDRKISEDENSVVDLAKTHGISTYSEIDPILGLPSFDYLISVQYHQIIAQKHIDCAQKLAINLHMAPLPELRGCNQFSFAIIDQLKEFGTTLHVLEAGIDSGDILFENRFPVPNKISVKELHQLTNEKSEQLITESFPQLFSGSYQRRAQSEYWNSRGNGFHLRKEIHEIKEIDLNWPEEKIDRYIRATYFPPFPPPFCTIKGQKIDLSPNWRNEIPS